MESPFRYPCRSTRGIPHPFKSWRRSASRGLVSKMSEQSDEPIVAPGAAAGESTNGGAEHRRQTRYSFTASAEVFELRSQTRVAGRCSDLSLGGCYVDTLSPFPVGSVVRIRVERDTRELVSMAVVAYAHV